MPTRGNSDSSEKKKPVLYIRTFGCQMNVRDSEVICGLLGEHGYKVIDAPEKADIVLFNTCSVRQHAEDKVWSEIGRITKLSSLLDLAQRTRQIKAGGTPRPTKKIVGLVGCMAQNYKELIFERAPGVDFVVGTKDLDKIPAIIEKLAGNGELLQRKIWETDGEYRPEEIYHTGFYQDKNHAYVVISEGCSNYCSYCVVPFVRGELRNRNQKEILKEIEGVVAQGITSITLLGQNVNAYDGFVDLLRSVNRAKGLKEFSFITSHPRDTSAELFKAMADLEKLKKYLHLPVQSGSDRILKLMNRGYTRKAYLDLIGDYRKIVKGGVLSTDIIVGFPSETEEDFLDTFNLVEDVEFDCAFIFKYSPRLKTEAAKMADSVAKEEKERRHRVILELQKEISRRKKC